MVRIDYCAVCGKMLQGLVRNCSYCGIILCKQHCINGLCPQHMNTMTPSQSQAIQNQRNRSTGIILCACPVLTFSLMFTVFGFIWGENYVFPLVSLAIFAVFLTWCIMSNRKSTEKSQQVMKVVKQQNQGRPFVNSQCQKCGTQNPVGSEFCVNCGNHL